MTVEQKAKELQTQLVIKFLMEDKGYKASQAAQIWYNSKTKAAIQDSDEDLSYVAPTRCYDELLMELDNHPHWMMGSFE